MELAKYLTGRKARLSLENKGFWFTRARNWSEIDPQETATLPALERYLAEQYGEDLRRFLFLAMCELQSGWVWGSSFAKFDGFDERLWREFGGDENDPGISLVVNRDKLYNAITAHCKFDTDDKSVGHVKVEPVVYLAHDDFSSLEVLGDPNQYDGGMFESSIFYKNIDFEHEKEVRAIISNNARFDFFLKDFCTRQGIQIGPASQPVQKGKISFVVNYGPEFSEHNWGVILSKEELAHFREEIKSDRFQTQKDWNGFYVPFSADLIEHVEISPLASGTDRAELNQLINTL